MQSKIAKMFDSKIGVELTDHAWKRMCGRGINKKTITEVLDKGRHVYTKGAEIYVIGKKEVKRWGKLNVNISDAEGVHVICDTDCKSIITVFRNKNLRHLRV